MPLAVERASDGYARWTRVVESILANAGIPGTFDYASTQLAAGADEDEWGDFLRAVHHAFGVNVWTVKEVLAAIDTGNLINPGSIPLDALPAELADKAARAGTGLPGIAKSLGKWLRNREGRWAGDLTVRGAGFDRTKTQRWQMTPRPGPCGCTSTEWCPQHWQALPRAEKYAWRRHARLHALPAPPSQTARRS